MHESERVGRRAAVPSTGVDGGRIRRDERGRSAGRRPRSRRPRPRTTAGRLHGPRVVAASTLGGVCGAGATVALREWGSFQGLGALVVVVVALLLIPTSREFSRRVLLSGASLLGWVQVLWWWPLPFDRVGWAAACVVGVGVGSAVRHLLRGEAIGQIFGRVRGVDALPPAVFGVGLIATRPWLTTRSGVDALSLLITGWDNSGHFDMFRMLWSHGRTIDTLATAQGQGQWQYDNYPQGFHATLVSIADLMWPAALHDVGSALLAYTHSVSLLMAAAAAVLAAGMTSLPPLRHRPEVALPLVALLSAAVLLGEGQELLVAGFGAFLYPCILAATAMFLVLLSPRVASPTWLLALGGMVAGVAHGWLPLLAALGPAAVAYLLPTTRLNWRASRRAWVLSVAIVAAAGYAVWRAVRILVDHGAGAESLTQPGGINPPPIGTSLASLIGAAAVAGIAAVVLWRPSIMRRRWSWRFLALSLTPVVSVAALAFVAKLQIDANGQVGYYMWKLLAGVGFMAIALVCAGLACAADALPRWRSAAAQRGAVAGAVLAGLGLTQMFGYFGPSLPSVGLVSHDRATTARQQFDVAAAGFRPDAEALLQAVAVPIADPFAAAYLQDPATGHLNPINAQQWFMSLHGTWTRQGNFASVDLAKNQATTADAVAVGRSWLGANGGQLVVPPSLYRLLAASGGAGRAVTWG